MLFLRKKSSPLNVSLHSRIRIDRKHDRITYETPITYKNYETKEITRGSLQNYSKGGLYIESENCPAVGTGALIYMDNYSAKAAGPNNLKQYHVQVRWVKQLSNQKEKIRYYIGVSNCKDVDELFRLFVH